MARTILYDGRLITDSPTGIGIYLINILEEILKIDSSFRHVIITDVRSLRLEAICKDVPNAKIIRIPVPQVIPYRIRQALFDQVFMPALAAGYGAELVFLPHLNVPFLGLKAFITVLHDMALMKFAENYGFTSRYYNMRMLRTCAKHARKIITVSHSSKRDIETFLKIDSSRVKVVYNGIRDDFRSVDKDRALSVITTKYGIPTPFILYSGGFGSRKNLPFLLDAFQLAYTMHDLPHVLVMIGKENAISQQLARRVYECGMADRVIFPGYIQDSHLPLFYGAAEFLIYVSTYEGFGFPIAEAMASGTPVLTSNCSSMAEIGNGAVLTVDPYDVEAIANGITSLAVDVNLRSRLIQRGLERSCIFDWSDSGLQTWKLICEALK